MKTTEYTSKSIECQGCARSVTAALTSLAGVHSVDVDVESQKVTVTHDEYLDPSAVMEASKTAGFEPDPA